MYDFSPVVLGPNITALHEGYASNEGLGGLPLNPDGSFFLPAKNVVEFLGLTNEQAIDKIVQVHILPELFLF